MDKQEILRRLHTSRSWRETGLAISDVIGAIDTNATTTNTNDDRKYTDEIRELKNEVDRLNAKVKNLSDTNKKLREDAKSKK